MPLVRVAILRKLDVPRLLANSPVLAETMADYDETNDDVNEAPVLPEPETGPEAGEDVGGEQLETAAALGLTEAPSAKTQGLLDQHPELWPDYEETVLERLIIRDAYPPLASGVKDPNHVTYPFLTMYERTKVLSLRASELAHGAPPYIEVPDVLTDVYQVAKAELEAKRLPYILKRPLPDGTFEYWRLADLMLL